MRGMWNPLIQGAKNLNLVVLEDKALMSEWLGGLVGGWWWLQCTQRISKHWAPCQGSFVGMIYDVKQQQLSRSLLKWTSSFPPRLNTAVVSCLPSGRLVLYAHPVLALMQWLGHLNVESHLGFFHQGPVVLRYNRYNPPFQAPKILKEWWYVSLQKMCCLSRQQGDRVALKAFLTVSMCVCTVACSRALTWRSPPSDSQTSFRSKRRKPCWHRQPRCGTCRVMYREDVIDEVVWLPFPLGAT